MKRPNERTVRLKNGIEVSDYSEEYRHECEAITVLAMVTDARNIYFDLVAKKRGAEAAQQLKNTVAKLWTDKTAREIIALERADLLAAEQRLERIGKNGTLGERLRAGVERRMQEIISTTTHERAA